jgi:hypothetical protein
MQLMRSHLTTVEQHIVHVDAEIQTTPKLAVVARVTLAAGYGPELISNIHSDSRSVCGTGRLSFATGCDVFCPEGWASFPEPRCLSAVPQSCPTPDRHANVVQQCSLAFDTNSPNALCVCEGALNSLPAECQSTTTKSFSSQIGGRCGEPNTMLSKSVSTKAQASLTMVGVIGGVVVLVGVMVLVFLWRRNNQISASVVEGPGAGKQGQLDDVELSECTSPTGSASNPHSPRPLLKRSTQEGSADAFSEDVSSPRSVATIRDEMEAVE